MPLSIAQRVFELDLPVEVIFDDRLVTTSDENEMLDPGFTSLINNVLDQWSIDHWQHFLRHGLGGRKKSRPEASNGEDGLPYSHNDFLSNATDCSAIPTLGTLSEMVTSLRSLVCEFKENHVPMRKL